MAKGKKTGGRSKGIPNKRTAETIAKVEASGLMPLDYMLSVLRNEHAAPELRMDAAHKAAPYVHARLSAVEHSGEIATRDTSKMTNDELLAIIDRSRRERTSAAPDGKGKPH